MELSNSLFQFYMSHWLIGTDNCLFIYVNWGISVMVLTIPYIFQNIEKLEWGLFV